MGETIDRKKLIEDLKDYAEWAEGKDWELPLCFSEDLKRAAQLLEEDAAKGWISVEDRLPEEHEDVLVAIRETQYCGKHQERRKAYRRVYTGWRVDGDWATTYCYGHRFVADENLKFPQFKYTVTHWASLPAPPEGEE